MKWFLLNWFTHYRVSLHINSFLFPLSSQKNNLFYLLFLLFNLQYFLLQQILHPVLEFCLIFILTCLLSLHCDSHLTNPYLDQAVINPVLPSSTTGISKSNDSIVHPPLKSQIAMLHGCGQINAARKTWGRGSIIIKERKDLVEQKTTLCFPNSFCLECGCQV